MKPGMNPELIATTPDVPKDAESIVITAVTEMMADGDDDPEVIQAKWRDFCKEDMKALEDMESVLKYEHFPSIDPDLLILYVAQYYEVRKSLGLEAELATGVMEIQPVVKKDITIDNIQAIIAISSSQALDAVQIQDMWLEACDNNVEVLKRAEDLLDYDNFETFDLDVFEPVQTNYYLLLNAMEPTPAAESA